MAIKQQSENPLPSPRVLAFPPLLLLQNSVKALFAAMGAKPLPTRGTSCLADGWRRRVAGSDGLHSVAFYPSQFIRHSRTWFSSSTSMSTILASPLSRLFLLRIPTKEPRRTAKPRVETAIDFTLENLSRVRRNRRRSAQPISFHSQFRSPLPSLTRALFPDADGSTHNLMLVHGVSHVVDLLDLEPSRYELVEKEIASCGHVCKGRDFPVGVDVAV